MCVIIGAATTSTGGAGVDVSRDAQPSMDSGVRVTGATTGTLLISSGCSFVSSSSAADTCRSTCMSESSVLFECSLHSRTSTDAAPCRLKASRPSCSADSAASPSHARASATQCLLLLSTCTMPNVNVCDGRDISTRAALCCANAASASTMLATTSASSHRPHCCTSGSSTRCAKACSTLPSTAASFARAALASSSTCV